MASERSSDSAYDSSAGVGWLDPRISFSVDFVDKGLDVSGEPAAGDLSDSGSGDFEFFVKERKGKKDSDAVDYSAEFEFCMSAAGRDPPMSGAAMQTADELFCNGKLLPLQMSQRMGLLDYVGPDEEAFRFAEEARSGGVAGDRGSGHEGHNFETPVVALSPSSVPQLTAVSSSAIPPPSSPLDPANFPFIPAHASSYTPAPDSPPLRVGSCLPSPSFRPPKAFRWKGLFGSLMKLKTGDPTEEFPQEDGQLDRTESRRQSFSRRLSFSFRRASAGQQNADEDVGVACGESPQGEVAPDSETQEVSDGGCWTEESRSGDPRSVACSSLRSYSSGSAAQSLDELIPDRDSNETSLDVVSDVSRSHSPARRAKHSRWIILSCGLRRGPSGPRQGPGRSPGSSSPTKLAVKVGDVDLPNTGASKILLKNLECVSSARKGCSKKQEHLSLLMQQKDPAFRSPEKLGSYAASVRVMPVLNVPLCNLAPALRAAKSSSSKGRFLNFRHIFSPNPKKEAEEVALNEEAHPEVITEEKAFVQ